MKAIPIAITIGMVTILFLIINPFGQFTDSRCKDTPNPSISIIDLEKTTWISVMKINENQTNLDCTLLSQKFLDAAPKLQDALNESEQCSEGHSELCTTDTGMSSTRIYNFGVPVSDPVNYEISLNQDEVKMLYDNIRLASNGMQSFGDVKYGNNYYQIVLLTSNKEMASQAYAEFAQKFSYNPIAIQKGQSLRFPITVKTLATYGKPAHIRFDASSSAADSNIGLAIEPPTVDIPERSEKNVTLVVTATPNTRDGIYGISVDGSADGGQEFGICHIIQCLSVSVNNSTWEIRTYPGNVIIGMGGNTSPKWLHLESKINKSVFYPGDIAEVANYLTNNSSNTIAFGEHTELVVTVYSESPEKGYQYYYVIQASYNGKPLDIQPHSTVLLARPFYMDLTSYHDNPNVLQRLEPGNYTVDIALNGYDGDWWDNDIPIVVK